MRYERCQSVVTYKVGEIQLFGLRQSEVILVANDDGWKCQSVVVIYLIVTETTQ